MKRHPLFTFIFILLGAFSLRNSLWAFDYFSSEINYWHDQTQSHPEKSEPGENKEIKAEEMERSFDWKKYMDPKNDSFFQEGDYKPPAPFLELVRNPTDANIQNWFTMVELKNKLSTQLQARIAEYVEKNKPALSPEAQAELKEKANTTPFTSDDYKNYRFRMYFDSHCPHCKHMMSTLEELQKRGFYVELKQIDPDLKAAEDLPFPITPASASELQEKDIHSVPVLFVGDLRKKVVYRLTGFQTPEQIFEVIRSKKGFQ